MNRPGRDLGRAASGAVLWEPSPVLAQDGWQEIWISFFAPLFQRLAAVLSRAPETLSVLGSSFSTLRCSSKH